MKILYVVTVGRTMRFFISLIELLIRNGNTVDIACGEDGVKIPDVFSNMGCNVFSVSFSRKPWRIADNIRAMRQIRQCVVKNQYDVVHCHTPIAGVVARLACRCFRKNGLKLFYTAHGFHFYKGAPLKNWLFIYPIEKYCSRFTDVLITINQEDYDLAKKKMKAKRVEYVPGVGIDMDRFANTIVDRAGKRKSLGIPDEAFLLLSVGEINKNKNHQIVIRALAELRESKIHYMIAGCGPLQDSLPELARRLNVSDQVHLLGYRTDVAELYKIADVIVFPSIREGFGLAAIEAMAAGLPMICSDNRGTREYADDTNSIRCYEQFVSEYAKAVSTMYFIDGTKLDAMKICAAETAKKYSTDNINEKMMRIYEQR